MDSNQRIVIASLNIRHGQGMPKNIRSAYTSFRHPKKSMEANAKHIAHRLKSLDPIPDIVCIQESNAAAIRWPDVTEIIRERLGFGYVAKAPQRILPHNNAIISRLPLLSTFSRQFKRHSLLRSGNPLSLLVSINRGFIGAEIEGIGTIINTHLDPFHPRVRDTEARELMSFIKPETPVILAGDFNASSFNEPSLRIISNKGFHTLPALDKKHFEKEATWPHVRHNNRTPFMRLDYIFATLPLTIIETKPFDTRLSDHSGVIATVEISSS